MRNRGSPPKVTPNDIVASHIKVYNFFGIDNNCFLYDSRCLVYKQLSVAFGGGGGGANSHLAYNLKDKKR